jgi:hypothetical protein
MLQPELKFGKLRLMARRKFLQEAAQAFPTDLVCLLFSKGHKMPP